jgi:hypothetical protein
MSHFATHRVARPARLLRRLSLAAGAGAALFSMTSAHAQTTAPRRAAARFEVTVAPAAHAQPLTGRLILVVAKQDKPEPRTAVSPQGPAVFGVDVEQLPAGGTIAVTDAAIGYPTSLAELPAGDYFVQAVVDVYTRLPRADGHTIWAHMNDGSIETFNFAAGNLYSEVQRVHVGDGGTVRLTVNHVIPRTAPRAETDWIKRATIQSPMLTRFWGHPVFIHAWVLLPKGYAEHPNVQYPAIYALGHAPTPFNFSTTSDEARAANYGEMRRGARTNPTTGVESGYDFYRSWTSDSFPRVIAITLEQQTPYFPDSYSVNSANNGPYGDAVVQEVMPYLESHFRIIPKPYARHLEGASTSGWQTLAMMLQHPDYFGGGWVLQPDPIDFHRYQLTDIYEDTNAFAIQVSPTMATERPFRRSVEGQVLWTTRQLSRFEAVLGSHGRSSYQLEAWEAVYGPVGPDGYPVPLWDKLTGTIDRKTAAYMRDHGFDLRDYAERNWPTLGPRLVGKLHFFAGDMDNFYLNVPVYRFEDFLKRTTNPHDEAEFTYGRPMKGHSWHSYTWAEMVRMMAASVAKAAPAGENTAAWHY